MREHATPHQGPRRLVRPFDEPLASGDTKLKLGGKGLGLARLAALGLPVPPGFTVTTSLARAVGGEGAIPKRLAGQLARGLAELERKTGRRLGDENDPLLVSVRSGAPASMPGMMDTVLNLGRHGVPPDDDPFSWRCHERFLSQYAGVVHGIEPGVKAIRASCLRSTPLARASVAQLKRLCASYLYQIEGAVGLDAAFNPRDPFYQLSRAILAVVNSWRTPRAVEYRKIHAIPEWWGTAVNVQAMVFGNRDARSCTGVVFSHNGITGEPGLWGEWLPEAQGEDVVGGTVTPRPIHELLACHPHVYEELDAHVAKLAGAFDDIVDVEFTVESGKLWILQVRVAKRSPQAAATFGVRRFWRKAWTREQVLASITPRGVLALQRPAIDPAVRAGLRPYATGTPASPGCAAGEVVRSSGRAVAARGAGPLILWLGETKPDDLPGMLAADGIVTCVGGASSHAALVARGLGKPCVVGVDPDAQLYAGLVTIDGGTGEVFREMLPMAPVTPGKEVRAALKWAGAAGGAVSAVTWPTPRADFSLVRTEAPAVKLIGNFYLSSLMDAAAAGTPLADEARRVRLGVHVRVAERLFTYLLVAVSGELRYGARVDKCRACNALRRLKRQLRLTRSARDREPAQASAVRRLPHLDTPALARLLERAVIAFNGPHWKDNFGGEAWAGIAACAHAFAAGEMPHDVFVDHAFDLEHNNGTVFGKHSMIYANRREQVTAALQVKKLTSGVRDLYTQLERLAMDWSNPSRRVEMFSSTVRDLYTKGLRLGLWA